MTEFILQQNQTREDYKNEEIVTKTPTYRKVLRNKSTRGITIVTIFAIAVPFLIYYLVIDEGSYPKPSLHTCAVNVTYQVPCGNKVNATQKDCDRINCCYDSTSRTCYHFLPSKYYYYQKNDNFLAFQKNTPFGTPSTSTVALTVDEVSEDVVKVILHDSNVAITGNTQASKKYSQKLYTDKLAVEIFRAASEDLILTTAKGPLIVSEHYWEWSFQLTEEYLFGLGETLFEFEELNTTFTKVVYNNKYDQNTLPIFMGYRNMSFHGMIVHHEGPLEVTILASNLVILKTLVGSKIELELSLGPTPKDVMAQQQTGTSSKIPPWALGVHVCRGGTTTSLKDILDEYEVDGSLKYDSDCIHENLWLAMLLNTDEAQKERLAKAVTDLEATATTKFVMSLPPQVLINSSLYLAVADKGLFYLNQSEEVYQGKYLDADVAYPYFGHKSIDKFMASVREEIKGILGLEPSNFILTNNWPEEDSYQMDTGSTFPYLSEGLTEAFSNTLPWNTKSDDVLHIYQHSDYGSLQLAAWEKALDPPTPDYFLMTSSHNFDTKSRPTLVENVDISWTNLKKSIKTMLYSSLFGSSLLSIPICGSTKNYDKKLQESLCMRWYLMASTSPLFRISSDLPRRDPDSLNTKFATETATYAIDMRKKLLPYYQTVLNKDEPLVRPMFYNFYKDTNTFGLDEQYMVGGSLLVAHPVVPDSSELRIYLPDANWFEFYSGDFYLPGWASIDIVETDWICFIPEGSVVPLITKGTAGADVVEDSLTFVIGLACNQPDVCLGTGSLDFGYNITVTFEANTDALILRGITKDVKNEIGCNNGRILKVDEMSVYRKNSVIINSLSSTVNLCDASDEVVTIKYPEP